jgi:hypothetical protein
VESSRQYQKKRDSIDSPEVTSLSSLLNCNGLSTRFNNDTEFYSPNL